MHYYKSGCQNLGGTGEGKGGTRSDSVGYQLPKQGATSFDSGVPVL